MSAPFERLPSGQWTISGPYGSPKLAFDYRLPDDSYATHVIEYEKYLNMEKLKDKAAEIAIAIGFEHNQKVKEIEHYRMALERIYKQSADGGSCGIARDALDKKWL